MTLLPSSSTLGWSLIFFCHNTQSHVQRQHLHLAGEFIAFLEFRLHQKVHLNPLYVVNLFICQIHLFASVRWLGPARDDFGVAWAALCSLVALSSLDSGTSTSTGSAARPSPLPSASFSASFPVVVSFSANHVSFPISKRCRCTVCFQNSGEDSMDGIDVLSAQT